MTVSDDLSDGERFVETLLECVTDDADASVTEHRRALVERFEAAAQRWPQLSVDADSFARFVALRLPVGRPAMAAIADMHLADLYLAAAASDPAAPQALLQYASTVLTKVAARFRHLSRAELESLLMTTLFVATDKRPAKIAAYSGTGDILRWIGVVASRLALRHRPKTQPDTDSELLDNAINSNFDPELGYLRQSYREAFRAAFASAVAELPAEDRNLLRYRYVDRLKGKQIADILGVHPSTVTRRLTQIAAKLRTDTLDALRSRFELSGNDVESVLRLVASGLDASVSRLLR